MATQPLFDMSKAQPIQASPLFDMSKAKPLSPPADQLPKGWQEERPTDEEQDFLAKNPDHQWLPADNRFPNRRPGIYPMGPGNEWRNDPNLNERKGNVDQFPLDLHFAKHTYEGAKQGLVAATAPLAIGATWPQIIAGVVGGGVGSVAGEQIAKRAGGGEMTQEVSGDVGGLLGGAVSAGVANIASSKARAIYEALPEGLQALLRKNAQGMASPRLKYAIDFWDGLRQAKDHFFGSTEPVYPGAHLPATPAPEQLNPSLVSPSRSLPGQIGPEVIRPPAQPIPARSGLLLSGNVEAPARFTLSDLDPANGGGLGKLPIAQPSPAPAPKTASAPGSAGSMVESVKAGGAKSASLLTRLRSIASDIDAHEKARITAATATAKSSPDPEQDLTELLLESLNNVRAKKAVTVQ